MVDMFHGTKAFNQSLTAWNVSAVTNRRGLFCGAISLNQPLNTWDVHRVLNKTSMFEGATSFKPGVSVS